LDAEDKVLAEGTSGYYSQCIAIPPVDLPATGTYRIVVQAVAYSSDSTGNYVLTASEIKYPRVLSHAPAEADMGPVSSVTFTFNQTIDQASFVPDDDIISFTGPTGLLAITGCQWTSANQLELTFASQTTLGEYALALGPAILNLVGNPMDQDQNSVGGESPADRYLATFTIEGPRIVNSTFSGVSSNEFDTIQVQFSQPMDPASFLPSDDIMLKGPQGPVSVKEYRWLDSQTLELTCDPQTAMGDTG